jgi:hypothetical protein
MNGGMMGYIFRREDTGRIIEVDFSMMMDQDAAGYITLDDGVQARRCVHLEDPRAIRIGNAPDRNPTPEIVSDAMGVTCNQVEEMRQDAAKNGIGVEFVRDPLEPTFYQAKFGSWKEWDRYRRHRGFTDNNGKNGGGATLTPAQFERAKQKILESHDARVVDISANAAQDGD